MAQRMAAERVAAEQGDVQGQHQRADADAKDLPARRRVAKPQRQVNVMEQNNQEDQRQVEEVAVNVLNDEREAALAEIGLAWLTDGAGWRVGPEGFVICATIVIAGHAKAARRPEDQQRRRKRQRLWPPSGVRAKP